MTRKFAAGFTFALTLVLAATAFAGEPVHREIPFSKKVPLYTPKTYTFHFSIYDAATDGTELWYEDVSLRLKNKTLTHNLGSVIAFADADAGPLDFSEQYWIQVSYWYRNAWKVIGTRDKLTASPYALWGVNPGPRGEQGIQGIQGEPGAKGDKGEQGPPGPGRLLVGCVSASGSITKGSGFSVTASPTSSEYVLAFDEPFLSPPICLCSGTGIAKWCNVRSSTETGASILTSSWSTGGPLAWDEDFCFQCSL